jgi:hypothetical protein
MNYKLYKLPKSLAIKIEVNCKLPVELLARLNLSSIGADKKPSGAR